MSRDWTPEELAQVSVQMKAAGHMSFEELCAELDKQMVEKQRDRDGSAEDQAQIASVGKLARL